MYDIKEIQRIYIDESLRDGVLAQNILQNILHRRETETTQIEYVTDPNSILKKHRIAGDQSSHQELLVYPFRGRFFSSCPGSDGMVCCQYFVIHLGQGCLYDCQYCYLQGFLNNPLMTLHGNIEDVFLEIDKITHGKKNPFRMGTGEYTDSLALEPLTGQAALMVDYFSKLPNATLELKTKSPHVDGLLNLEHKGRTVISWSLNPETVIEQIEKGTASLEQRLIAAQKAQEAGYKVAFHLDPLIYFEDWKKQYHNLIETIFNFINPNAIAWMSIGSFRYTSSLKEVIQARFPQDTLIRQGEMSRGSDGKYRYYKNQRQEMFLSLKKKIESVDPNIFLYLCMESKRMWQNVFGFIPETGKELDSLFEKRQQYLRNIK